MLKHQTRAALKPSEPSSETEDLIIRLKDHAENLYGTRQLLCTEAVLVALNQGLDGGLTEEQAVSMAAPFCVGLGDSGCLCGALSGAVLAAGLFIGRNRPYLYRKEMREAGRSLHHTFKTTNGSTCCRCLTKKVKQDKKAHFNQCKNFTADAAEMAARLILEKRPELIKKSSLSYDPRLRGRFTGTVAKIIKLFA